MEVRLSGKVRWVSPVQPANAPVPMVVRPSGKVTEVSPVQQMNAPSPIVVRLAVDRKVMEVSLVQFLNANSPIVIRLSGRSAAISFSNEVLVLLNNWDAQWTA